MKLYNINRIPAKLLPQVGGKARGLHELVKFGFQVPKAFIVTDIRPDDDLRAAVQKYKKDGYKLVSVRSSATLEDGDGFSAAGQFSTVLNVEGEEALVKAIQECVASLHNKTAEEYSKTFLHSAESRMTVVVQQMITPACAGVIFSRSPMRPGYVLVEAVPGLGENLVSGKMSAQQYLVRKERVINESEQPLLSEKEALNLGKQAHRAEKRFRKPMDLEWAMDEKHEVYWLQARPITVEESVTLNELDTKHYVAEDVLTTANIGEVIPGAVTPLNLSTSMYALDWGVMETFWELGTMRRRPKPFSFIPHYYNHMFFDMTTMYNCDNNLFGTSKKSLDISLAGHEFAGFPDGQAKRMWLPKRAWNTVKFVRMVYAGEAAKKGMDRTIAGIRFDLSQDMHGIYRQILRNFDGLKWANYWHYRTSYYSGGQTNIMMSKVSGHIHDTEQLQSLIAGCLTDIDDFESANVLRLMRQLAQKMLLENPGLRDATPEQMADYMGHEASHKVRAEYDAFIRRHGHRGLREMEIRSATWRSNPTSFFSSLKSVIVSIQNEGSKSGKPWQEYADELCSYVEEKERKKLRKLIDNARRGVCYREYTKAKVIFALDQFRQAYGRLARLMVDAGLLPDEDAIFFLTQQEVGCLLKGENASLVKRAIARRRLLPQQMDLHFREVQMGRPEPLVSQESNPNATLFRGIPVSRGVAKGLARVVRTEADAARLQKGEIMISQGTDIGWTPYYNIIAGLATEIGSALSHGVVVAREYALPTVVAIPNILNEIHTGDLVSLDANTGTLIVEKRAITIDSQSNLEHAQNGN